MGACFQSIQVKASTPGDVRVAYRRHQDQMRTQYGTDPYNGTMSNCDDVRVVKTPMTRDEAETYCETRLNKREAAAIPLKDKPGHWYIGAWCPE